MSAVDRYPWLQPRPIRSTDAVPQDGWSAAQTTTVICTFPLFLFSEFSLCLYVYKETSWNTRLSKIRDRKLPPSVSCVDKNSKTWQKTRLIWRKQLIPAVSDTSALTLWASEHLTSSPTSTLNLRLLACLSANKLSQLLARIETGINSCSSDTLTWKTWRSLTGKQRQQ